MRPVNIFALTRTGEAADLQRLERQMSGRDRYLKIKEWELEGVRKLTDHLMCEMGDPSGLSFYYSFVIPKLGKEFDLIAIGEDAVVNVELKSRPVSEEAMKEQLLQNRYYLASLGKNIRSYTFESGSDRLFRLTGSERIAECGFSKLAEDLARLGVRYEGEIEELFAEDEFIISPLTQPDRFLAGEYFLTSQQRDIKRHILETAGKRESLFFGFTGLPGTGKTLLLYDMAMELSARQRVCIFHCGTFSEELRRLDGRLKRIDFFPGTVIPPFEEREPYTAILVDVAQRMEERILVQLAAYAGERRIPMILSYDSEDAVALSERENDIPRRIRSLPDFAEYRLTNRIRMNRELSLFIKGLISGKGCGRGREFPSVEVGYAETEEDLELLLRLFDQKGYVRLSSTANAAEREYPGVVMVMDERFAYGEAGLTARRVSGDAGREEFSPVRELFYGLNRARQRVAVVVYRNREVFQRLLLILQGKGSEDDEKQ